MGDKKKEGKSIVLNILVVLLCIVIVLLLAIIFLMSRGRTTSKNDKGSRNQTLEKVETVSDDLKTDLSKKIVALLYLNSEDVSKESISADGYSFRKNILKKKLTLTDKQEILLESLKYKEISKSKWKEVPEVKKFIDNDSDSKEDFGYLSYDTVNSEYKKLFGVDLEKPKVEVGKCPTYLYSENTLEFYQFPSRCGGANDTIYYIYKSKYEKNGDKVVVYVSVGVGTSADDNSGVSIYGDYSFDDDGFQTFKNLVETINYDAAREYSITIDNYDKFSEYKFIFRKSGNNYYFNKVVQVK